MKIGMIGLGKLGFPVALAWASRGHEVVGHDVSPHAHEIMRTRTYPHREPGAQRLLDAGVQIEIVDSIAEVVTRADIVFVAVQTPHGPEYEGVMRVPETTADFDYSMLRVAVAEIATQADAQAKHVTLVVISTVLPGTSERELLPIVKDDAQYVSFVYAPMFIAQSTVVEDTLNPEFVLLGVDKSDARGVEEVKAFFESLYLPAKLRFMSVASAEACKIAYNTTLGQKIVNANYWMEICEKTGANVDDVMGALKCATDRIMSSKYMNAGMGDGGGCHPRDMIALSYLAERLDLSYDLGGQLARAREAQTEWLADLAIEESKDGKLPIVVLGKAFKRGTNLTIGSPAILLANMLREYPHLVVHQWDPHVDGFQGTDGSTFIPTKGEVMDGEWLVVPQAAVYVIAIDHDEFFKLRCTIGSVVIDPWGKLPDREGVKVIRVGRK